MATLPQRSSSKRTHDLDPQWLKYFQLRLDQTILHRACNLLQAIRAQVSAIGDQLKRLVGELNVFADELAGPLAGGQIDAEVFAKHGGLRAVLEKGIDLRGPFCEVLRGAPRTAVFRALNQVNIAELFLASDQEMQESNQPLRALLETATPPLLKCGGSRRILLVCPEGSRDASMEEAFKRQLDEKPSVVHDSDGDLVLCCEAEGLSRAAVAARLVDNRCDYVQVASRLHTRIDVAWSSLLQTE